MQTRLIQRTECVAEGLIEYEYREAEYEYEYEVSAGHGAAVHAVLKEGQLPKQAYTRAFASVRFTSATLDPLESYSFAGISLLLRCWSSACSKAFRARSL